MNDRYIFRPLTSIREGRQRMRLLIRGVRDIDRQLGDKTIQRSQQWRAKAIRSKLYKQAEYDLLKEEVQDLRIAHAANRAGIYDTSDPRHLLLRLREELALADKGAPHRMAEVRASIDLYFEHDGGRPDGRKEA